VASCKRVAFPGGKKKEKKKGVTANVTVTGRKGEAEKGPHVLNNPIGKKDGGKTNEMPKMNIIKGDRLKRQQQRMRLKEKEREIIVHFRIIWIEGGGNKKKGNGQGFNPVQGGGWRGKKKKRKVCRYNCLPLKRKRQKPGKSTMWRGGEGKKRKEKKKRKVVCSIQLSEKKGGEISSRQKEKGGIRLVAEPIETTHGKKGKGDSANMAALDPAQAKLVE